MHDVNTFDELADGTRTEVPKGELFAIRLAENPTTGFRWRADAIGAPVLELRGDAFEAATPLVPGSPGHHLWRFRAVDAGTTTIRLGYCRRGGPDVRTFTLQVEIR